MEPIVIEFDVSAAPEHAYATWTQRCGMWWPATHSVGQAEGFEVVFEPIVGGRIFERTAEGIEHEWGTVTRWEPPHLVSYRWHIFLPPDRATEVSVTFTPTDVGTRVRVENVGFEIFGDGAEERMVRVGGAWGSITDRYRLAVGELLQGN